RSAAAAIRSVRRESAPRARNCRREECPGGMDPSDEDLMRRVARGDEPAFRLLARRYAARAVGLARRITGNDADAGEVGQAALLRLGPTAPRWRPLASFRPWFYRVVLNLCLSRRRRPPLLPLDAAGDPADPARAADAALADAEVDRQVAA